MAIGGVSRDRILFVLDLDDSHFDNSKKEEVTWLGGENFWINLYSELAQELNRNNIDALFCVVTNKQSFDDICAEAAKKLKPFLALHNEHAYSEDEQWVLTKNSNRMQFEYIDGWGSDVNVPSDHFSHFVILPYGCKSVPILEIAKKYEITPSHCILIDDNPEVLLNVQAKGITILPLLEFHQAYDDRRLDSKEYVDSVLIKAKNRLKEIVADIVHAIEEKKNYQQNFSDGELEILIKLREKARNSVPILPMFSRVLEPLVGSRVEAEVDESKIANHVKKI